MGKCLQLNVLAQVGGWYLVFTVASFELLVYFIYKAVRRDLRYWPPLPGKYSIFVSWLMRVVVKTVSDFTGFLHARHPYEMGGFYWLLNGVYVQMSLLGALKLKKEFGWKIHGNDGDEFPAFSDECYRDIAYVLLVCWIVSMASIILASEKEFRHTFYSLRTAKQYSFALFNCESDSIKIRVLSDHRDFYSWYEDKIKEWFLENWDEWMAARPDWLTDEWIATVPFNLLLLVENDADGSGLDRFVTEETEGTEERKRGWFSFLPWGLWGSIHPKYAPTVPSAYGEADDEEEIHSHSYNDNHGHSYSK